MFIIIYQLDECTMFPMAWDSDCKGAVCCMGDGDAVALFPTRADARVALKISQKFAALCKAQGRLVNTDFLPLDRSRVRIVPCVAKDSQA